MRDGFADRLLDPGGAGWRGDADVALPWLSHRCVLHPTGGNANRTAEITARLKVLQCPD